MKGFFNAWFERFQSTVTWPCCFVPVGTQFITARACGKGSLFTSWWLRGNERQEGARVPLCPSRDCPNDITFFHDALSLLPPNTFRAGDQAFTAWAGVGQIPYTAYPLALF
jgi:hypothetical protein